ncbi:P-II family nitrogen regulator [Collinsella sp. An2]|uniref:P-II family nitrogen regulator n=1 Tax=Collinsella sp. An2 TaxID=1965585 RepID=UPI000B375FCC|nr:P-II family nitrogen regulator [Collinsella sp. An2]OUP07449.1 nitrogen fixation protein NifD [Collinsella sp. An2]
MKMIEAIVRPERTDAVLRALREKGFAAVTRMDVYGRGKQQGLRIGESFYDELPKNMLLMVIDDASEEAVVSTIMETARTGEAGVFGDGRIFVTPVLDAYTISSKTRGL